MRLDERAENLKAEKQKFLAALETLGEVAVRKRVAGGAWSYWHRQVAGQWLKGVEAEREAEERAAAIEASALNRSMAEAARDAAEASRAQAEEAAEANRIARRALDKAQTANTIATVAAIAATVSIAATVISAFVN